MSNTNKQHLEGNDETKKSSGLKADSETDDESELCRKMAATTNRKRKDPPNTIASVLPDDILCGRGRPYQEHPGNVSFLNIVERFKDRYGTSRRRDKIGVVEDVMKLVKGRFLKRCDEGWIQVDEDVVRDKVGHALRAKGRSGGVKSEGKCHTKSEEEIENDSANRPRQLQLREDSHAMGSISLPSATQDHSDLQTPSPQGYQDSRHRLLASVSPSQIANGTCATNSIFSQPSDQSGVLPSRMASVPVDNTIAAQSNVARLPAPAHDTMINESSLALSEAERMLLVQLGTTSHLRSVANATMAQQQHLGLLHAQLLQNEVESERQKILLMRTALEQQRSEASNTSDFANMSQYHQFRLLEQQRRQVRQRELQMIQQQQELRRSEQLNPNLQQQLELQRQLQIQIQQNKQRHQLQLQLQLQQGQELREDPLLYPQQQQQSLTSNQITMGIVELQARIRQLQEQMQQAHQQQQPQGKGT